MRRISVLPLLLCIGMTASATAGITRLAVTSSVPYGTFKPGEFVRVEGTVTGELSPAEPIPGLDRAPRNARGMVEYKAPFVLILPKDRSGGSGALLVDVPNRGRAISHFLYNSPRDPFVPIGTFEPGNGFLQDYGFTVAMLQWEFGQGIVLPQFKDGT